MNSVERVRSICLEKKIPISRLEKDLGFGNGYISQLRKGIFPANRLVAIANYLNVSTDYLLNGENEKAPTDEGERIVHKEKREVLAGKGISILLDADAKVTEDQLDDIVEFIKFKQGNNGR